MKKKSVLFICSMLMLSLNTVCFSQSDETKDRNFRLEVEPGSFVLRGFGSAALYNLTEDNNLSAGLHFSMLDVPDWTKEMMFDNVSPDSSTVRLGFHGALMMRYRIKVFEQWESNPYVGLIAGYEYSDIEQSGYLNSVRLSSFVATPYVGYEFYFFKQMIYINPQLRSAFYFGSKSSDITRPEKMGTFLLLPQVSVGLRF